MPVRLTLLAIGLVPLAVCTATTGASASQPAGMIAFSTNRAQNLNRVGIYSVTENGKHRRLLSLPTPPVSVIVRSPGGRRILFERMVDGNRALFAADLSGANAVRLTTPNLEPAFFEGGAAFSPDGQKVVFTSFKGCGYRCGSSALWIVQADGSGLHRLAENASLPSWAPDSRRLAYNGPLGIYVADADGQRTGMIADGYRPVWAPRGNRIAYNRTAGGYGVACLVDADGSHGRCLYGRSAKRLVWSPDARQLAFEQVSPARLAVVQANGSGLRYLESVRRRRNLHFPVAWSPGGRRLAFVDRDSSQIYVLKATGPPETRQVTHESGRLSDIRWRGNRISFGAYRWQNDYELASMQPDGSGIRILTRNSADDREPDWSPDGRTIVFSRQSGRLGELRLIDPDGSDDRPLTQRGPWLDGSPSWSPDGLRVAFVRSPVFTLSTLMIVNRDGSGLQQISPRPVYDNRISWSPDGRFIVASALTGLYDTDLYVFAVDGSGWRRIATGHTLAVGAAWSPDGMRILFTGNGPSKTGRDLFTINPDGTGLAHVAGNVASSVPGGAWAPDGQEVVFARDSTGTPYAAPSSIALIGADGQGLRDVTDNYSSNVDPTWTR